VLKALQIINRNEIPFRYIVVGEGPERESLQQLSTDLGLQNKITFTGYISDEDKWRLLQASDLYVMPSRVRPEDQHEGFGIAFLEAAACGIPSSEQTPVAFPKQFSMEKRACSLNRIRPKRSHKLLLSFTETLPFACEWEWQQENGRVRSFPQASSRHSFTKSVTAHLGCLFALLLPVSKLSSCAKS
jgi:hypothetical protein